MGILKDVDIVLLLTTNKVSFSSFYQIVHNIYGKTFSLFTSVNRQLIIKFPLLSTDTQGLTETLNYTVYFRDYLLYLSVSLLLRDMMTISKSLFYTIIHIW